MWGGGAAAIGRKSKRQSFTRVSRMPTKRKKAGPAFAGPAPVSIIKKFS